MTTYGLTPDGFVPKSLAVVRDQLIQALRAAFGPGVDLGDKSAFGQVIGILAEREALLWELAESINSSQDPAKAAQAALDALCTLTGTFRPAAQHSVVTLTLFGDAGTVINTGSLVGTDSSLGALNFQTTQTVTITALPTWAATTAYVVGDRIANDVDKMYQCITGGTSGGGGGPTGFASDITDGSVHWKTLIEGVTGGAAVDVHAQSVDTGAIIALAIDLSVINSPTGGWDAVRNFADATLGRAVASDAELRALRELELSNPGNGTIDAIIAHIAQIFGVLQVTLFVNDTDSTDSDGLPPHSVEVLVRTTWSPSVTDDQVIVDTIFASVAAGIATYSSVSTSGTATDTQGTTHTVFYSRPTEIPIYSILNVVVNAETFPTDGATQIKDAIVAFGQAQNTGKNAVSNALLAEAFKITGMLDVTSCFIGVAPGPMLSTTIPIALRELATYSSTNITVNVTTGTP